MEEKITINHRESISKCSWMFNINYEDMLSKHNLKIYSLSDNDIVNHIIGFRELLNKIISFYDLNKQSTFSITFNIKKEHHYDEFENMWTLNGLYKLSFFPVESINDIPVSKWISDHDLDYDLIDESDKTYQFYTLFVAIPTNENTDEVKIIDEYLVVFKYNNADNSSNCNYSVQYYNSVIDDIESYNIIYDGIKTITFNRPGKRNLTVIYNTESKKLLRDFILTFLRKYLKEHRDNLITSIDFIYDDVHIFSKCNNETESEDYYRMDTIVIKYNDNECFLSICMNNFIEIMKDILIQVELSISYDRLESINNFGFAK